MWDMSPAFQERTVKEKPLDELNHSLREVVGMLLEDGEPSLEAEFVGIQTVQLQ